MIRECFRCRWVYPDHLLKPLHTGGSLGAGQTAPICGICALDLSNTMLNLTRSTFSGLIAENHRQQALRWRQDHPEHNPEPKPES